MTETEWMETTWGDIAFLEYGKGLLNYSNESGKVPVYGTNGLIGYTDKVLCSFPSVIIGRKGAYRGVHFSKTPFYVIDTAFYLIPKIEDMDLKFAYYQLLTQNINLLDSGSAIPSTSRSDFYSLHVTLPPLPEQRAIADVLSALDDKIDLNRRMNQTLEQLARTIFKHMFIDNPERATWQEKTLGEVADVNWGDTNITKASYVPNGYLAYSAKGPDGLLPYFDYNKVGVVVSAIGANSGSTWLAQGKWSCIKNTIRFWSTSPDISTEYLYFSTNSKEKWPLRGSAQPFISQSDARNIRILIPDNKQAIKFGQIVEPLFSLIKVNETQNNTLSDLCATLLPRLMSGQVRVKF